MSEAKYQRELIKKLRFLFPDSVILKNDAGYLQGIPDLSIFVGDRYAMLEVKVSEVAPAQPNQEHYVQWFSERAFAAFIYPENEEEVLRALRCAFQGV
jgi:hypothetical protein